MNPYVSLPREALAELLRNSGSTLTPEQYLASFQAPTSGKFKKYPSRAWAALLSKYGLVVIAIFGVLIVPFLGDYIENGIIVVGLVTVTCFEYRVHRYFKENDPRAPSLGYRNQALFACAIVLYCLYHGVKTFHLSNDEYAMIEDNNLAIDPSMITGMVRFFYLLIAIIAGGSQFALARYYRSAEVKDSELPVDRPATPPPYTGS